MCISKIETCVGKNKINIFSNNVKKNNFKIIDDGWTDGRTDE